jgi:hypothetical protein
MSSKTQSPVDQWALFRFSVVGGLLAKPPAKGELCKELTRLAERSYMHPVHKRLTVFHYSTIESWYYKAKNAEDPIMALGRKIRSDIGKSIVFTPHLMTVLARQYKTYPNWSFQLHTDNLAVEIEDKKISSLSPSYASVRRYMSQRGWFKKSSCKKKQTDRRTDNKKRPSGLKIMKSAAMSLSTPTRSGIWTFITAAGGWPMPKVNGILPKPCALWMTILDSVVTFNGI